MVLSNKKLKQRIRSQLAESLSKSDSQLNLKDSQPPQSFKSLLNSITPKPILSKREKRRVKIPNSELQNQENSVENGNKKRKRDIDEVEVKNLSEKKSSSSSKKKKKKKNKKKKVVKEEEGIQKENGGIVVADPGQIQTSKEDTSNFVKIFVGGIPYYSTVDDIRSYFEGCGSITEIDCLKFPETGKFNGIAMISFRTEAAAKRALALDGSDMGGLILKIQPYKAIRDKKVSDFAPAMLEGYNRIYVGNLSWDTTEDELKKLFSDCRISSIRLGKDKETGEFRGFAHVDFVDSLSLTMALKLDQKPLFGRPVRIRCAVPPKSVNPSSNIEPTFVKTEANVKYPPIGDTIVDDDVARKAKGRTCYECGEKGHLSSACPNKKSADVAYTGNDDVAFDKTDTFKSTVVALDEYEDNNVRDSKLKRRTCYECGERGHLSSSCPKSRAADLANSGSKGNEITLRSSNETVDMNTVSDGKLRRRTCYECGERGHLSSLCPNKKSADVASLVKEGDDMEVEKAEVAAVGNNVVNPTSTSVSGGKLRRRSCYECGEKGHLSSMCPNKSNTA